MDKEKILAVILGVAGVALTFYFMTLSRVAISDIHYEHWEIVMFSDALLVWSFSFVFGILALVFHNERKSPYLMVISTIEAAIGWAFPYFRFVRLGIAYQTGPLLMFAIIHLVILLASAILLAYTNIWKKFLKESRH